MTKREAWIAVFIGAANAQVVHTAAMAKAWADYAVENMPDEEMHGESSEDQDGQS